MTVSEVIKAVRRSLADENQRWGERLAQISVADATATAGGKTPPVLAWRSRRFLVQAFIERGHYRLTFCRAAVNDDGRWKDGITWDELMELKRQAGFADRCCVEVYPPDEHVVDVANMRHLWVLPEPPPFMWKKGEP